MHMRQAAKWTACALTREVVVWHGLLRLGQAFRDHLPDVVVRHVLVHRTRRERRASRRRLLRCICSDRWLSCRRSLNVCGDDAAVGPAARDRGDIQALFRCQTPRERAGG